MNRAQKRLIKALEKAVKTHEELAAAYMDNGMVTDCSIMLTKAAAWKAQLRREKKAQVKP
jgi:hypothetical protein